MKLSLTGSKMHNQSCTRPKKRLTKSRSTMRMNLRLPKRRESNSRPKFKNSSLRMRESKSKARANWPAISQSTLTTRLSCAKRTRTFRLCWRDLLSSISRSKLTVRIGRMVMLPKQPQVLRFKTSQTTEWMIKIWTSPWHKQSAQELVKPEATSMLTTWLPTTVWTKKSRSCSLRIACERETYYWYIWDITDLGVKLCYFNLRC